MGSARNDDQITIKQLVFNACRQEGANEQTTELTCLTDGAKNCWSISKALSSCCKEVNNILDWFHITKRFTIINNSMDTTFREKLNKVKWFLWHGKGKEALERLLELQTELKDEKLLTRLQDLYEYLHRNQCYLVNYKERQSLKLPFTSTITESSVNALINTRQKNNKKMQWFREGAHHILQIRTSLFSKSWDVDWESAQKKMYQQVI